MSLSIIFLRDNFSVSAQKKTVGILIGIMLNLQITLDSVDILTMLSLTTHEYDVFHLLG